MTKKTDSLPMVDMSPPPLEESVFVDIKHLVFLFLLALLVMVVWLGYSIFK